MSSKIVAPNSLLVESVSWRRAGEPEPQSSQPAEGEVELDAAAAAAAEIALLRQAVSTLDNRLTAAVQNANEREARALEAGRQQGHAAGKQAGAAAAEAECSGAIAAVQAEATERAAGAAAQAVDLRRRLRQQMEADLVSLAVAVARRIVRRELTVDPEALMGIIKSSVERISARELLAIRVAPPDAPCVSARLASLHLPDRVEVIADSTLAWGSVLFDTERGQHDASVDTQFEEIDRGLADLAGRAAG